MKIHKGNMVEAKFGEFENGEKAISLTLHFDLNDKKHRHYYEKLKNYLFTTGNLVLGEEK